MSDIKISSILGNAQKLDGGAMFGNVPRPLWTRWFTPDELGRISLECRCLVIQIDGKNILCETGIGSFMPPDLAERYGIQDPSRHLLLENLHSQLRLSHEDFDYVVLSHLHFDHAGGLLPNYSQIKRGNNQLLFPNAKYVVGETALKRAQAPHYRDRASFFPEITDQLINSRRLLVNSDQPQIEDFFNDHISFFFSEGHTTGHMHLILKNNNHKLVFAGDLIPGTSWVHLPITMGYDRFPEKLIDEKQSLYNNFEKDKDWVFYTHDPEFSCSQISQDSKNRFVATNKKSRFTNWEF